MGSLNKILVKVILCFLEIIEWNVIMMYWMIFICNYVCMYVLYVYIDYYNYNILF